MIGGNIFDNLLFNNCKIVLKRRQKIKSAPNWPLLKNEIIFRKDGDEETMIKRSLCIVYDV